MVSAIALLALPSSSIAGPIGGHRLEMVVAADWINFDRSIRFEDSLGTSFSLLAEVYPGATLGLEFGHAGARDRERESIADVLTVAIRGRVEPFALGDWRMGAVLGVSFLNFEDQASLDSVSEGFELGPTVRWNIDRSWRLRLDWLWRVQTVSRPSLDPAGVPTGEQTETGYLWSSVARMGVGIAF